MEPGPTRREFLSTVGGTALAVAAADGAGAVQVDGEPWPMLCYDVANTAHNPASSAPREAIGQRWGYETGATVSTSPAVVDGVVYFGSWDGTVYAVDVSDGTLKWQFGTGGDVRSAPTVAEGVVYVGSNDGNLYALDAATGDEEWRFEADDAIVSAPAVHDGSVYVGSWDSFIYAVDASDGTETWSYETDAAVNSSPAIHVGATDDAGQPADVSVVIGSDDKFVYAIDAASGDERWAFETDGEVPASPAVAGGTVFVGSLDRSLYAIDAAAGEQDWEAATAGAIVASPAVASGRVYVPTRAGFVIAYQAETGEDDWAVTADLPTVPPTVAGDVLLVSGERGVAGFDAASGDPVWAIDASGPSAPVVANEEVYVSSASTMNAVAPGFDAPLGTDVVQAPDAGSESEGPLADYRFLLWPVSALAGVAMLVGLGYAAKRSGALDWIETRADEVGGEGPPTHTDAADGDAGGADPAPVPVWEALHDDVIGRAERTDRTASQNLIVTKYVDSDTFDAPVVAYEIESVRDDPATIRLTEPVPEDPEDPPRSMDDDWTISADALRYEQRIEPDDVVRTLVGRPDWDGELDALLERPDILVEDEDA